MMEWLVLLDWDRRHWPLAIFFAVWATATVVGGLFGHVLAGLVVGMGLGMVAALATIVGLR